MSENDKSDKILSLNWNCEWMIKASREGVFVIPTQPDSRWHFCIILVFLERNLATCKRTVKLTPLDSIGDLVYLRDKVNRGIKWQAPWCVAHGHFPLGSAVRNSQWPSIHAGGDTAKLAGIDKGTHVHGINVIMHSVIRLMGRISEKIPAVGMVWTQG